MASTFDSVNGCFAGATGSGDANVNCGRVSIVLLLEVEVEVEVLLAVAVAVAVLLAKGCKVFCVGVEKDEAALDCSFVRDVAVAAGVAFELVLESRCDCDVGN